MMRRRELITLLGGAAATKPARAHGKYWSGQGGHRPPPFWILRICSRSELSIVILTVCDERTPPWTRTTLRDLTGQPPPTPRPEILKMTFCPSPKWHHFFEPGT